MIENISQIIELMNKKRISKKELARLTGYSASSISDILNGKTPLSERFSRIVTNALEGDSHTVINGDNHHIDIHHAHTVGEKKAEYSPAIEMILDVVKDWDEVKRRKLAVKAVEMNGEESP